MSQKHSLNSAKLVGLKGESVAEEEIIPTPPETWNKGYKFVSFDFMNYDDCEVSVNGGDYFELGAKMGLSIKPSDEIGYVESIKVKQSGISFYMLGGY